MLAGVMGAIFGLAVQDADPLRVDEEDMEDAGGAGGGMERSTGEGVSPIGVKNCAAEPVPCMAGVDVAEDGEDASRMFGETRLRTPPCSSPLEDTVRLRCGRCGGCGGAGCWAPPCCSCAVDPGSIQGLVSGERS